MYLLLCGSGVLSWWHCGLWLKGHVIIVQWCMMISLGLLCQHSHDLGSCLGSGRCSTWFHSRGRLVSHTLAVIFVSEVCMRVWQCTELEATSDFMIARNEGQGEGDGSHSQLGSKQWIQSAPLRRQGSPLPALDEDATLLLPLGHLSVHTGLGSHLCLAFAALFIVDRPGHGWCYITVGTFTWCGLCLYQSMTLRSLGFCFRSTKCEGHLDSFWWWVVTSYANKGLIKRILWVDLKMRGWRGQGVLWLLCTIRYKKSSLRLQAT